MKTLYATKKQFNNLKTVETFPNPDVKITEIRKQKVRVAIAGKVTISECNTEQANWHNYKGNEKVVLVSCESGFYPTELFCNVVNQRYVPIPELGMIVASNLGTATNMFLADKLETVISILEENNFEVNKSIQSYI